MNLQPPVKGVLNNGWDAEIPRGAPVEGKQSTTDFLMN